MSNDPARFDRMAYRACGHSGLKLSALALGLWHNFGGFDDAEQARAVFTTAIDQGITHIDLANNYGPPAGAAEENFARLLCHDYGGLRDDLVIATKAGHPMQKGPYGSGGSRKYLVSSCEASLRRMGLDYVDIFYHHTPDPQTPLEETAGALAHLVHSGKALYVGVSSYKPQQVREIASLLAEQHVPLRIHQPRYNLFDRNIESELLPALEEMGIGCAVFSPLDQGRLTDRYLNGIPEDSRAAKSHGWLKREQVTQEVVAKVRRLRDEVARPRGWTMAQLAVAWVLHHRVVTSAIFGASKPEQVTDLTAIIHAAPLTADEVAAMEAITG